MCKAVKHRQIRIVKNKSANMRIDPASAVDDYADMPKQKATPDNPASAALLSGRIDRGKSRRWLAATTGLAESDIYRWETSTVAGLLSGAKIMNALGMTTDELILRANAWDESAGITVQAPGISRAATKATPRPPGTSQPATPPRGARTKRT